MRGRNLGLTHIDALQEMAVAFMEAISDLALAALSVENPVACESFFRTVQLLHGMGPKLLTGFGELRPGSRISARADVWLGPWVRLRTKAADECGRCTPYPPTMISRTGHLPPRALADMIFLLDESGERLQDNIARVCEAWWKAELDRKEELIVNTVCFLLIKSLRDRSTGLCVCVYVRISVYVHVNEYAAVSTDMPPSGADIGRMHDALKQGRW